jgi:hypothetical protein
LPELPKLPSQWELWARLRRRCEDARPARACARGSQGHRPGSSDAVVQATLLSEASHEALRLAASHRGQRRQSGCLFDRQAGLCAALWEDGRTSKSARKSVRKASVAAGVQLARKRERAEREGRLSRSNKAMKGWASRAPAAHRTSPVDVRGFRRSPARTARKSMTWSCPKRRRAKRTCELMAERTRCVAKLRDDQGNLPEPRGRRGDGRRRRLDEHRRISAPGHISLLVGNRLVLPHQGGTCLSCFATGSISLRNSWEREQGAGY